MFKNLPNMNVKLVLLNSSVAMKNGKSVGNILVAQRVNPFWAATILDSE